MLSSLGLCSLGSPPRTRFLQHGLRYSRLGAPSTAKKTCTVASAPLKERIRRASVMAASTDKKESNILSESSTRGSYVNKLSGLINIAYTFIVKVLVPVVVGGFIATRAFTLPKLVDEARTRATMTAEVSPQFAAVSTQFAKGGKESPETNGRSQKRMSPVEAQLQETIAVKEGIEKVNDNLESLRFVVLLIQIQMIFIQLGSKRK